MNPVFSRILGNLFPNMRFGGGGSAPTTSAAVQDLGLGGDTQDKTQAELDEIKRRKRLFGDNANAMSPAVMSLTGNQF